MSCHGVKTKSVNNYIYSNVLIALNLISVFSVAVFLRVYEWYLKNTYFWFLGPKTNFWVEQEVYVVGQMFFEHF